MFRNRFHAWNAKLGRAAAFFLPLLIGCGPVTIEQLGIGGPGGETGGSGITNSPNSNPPTDGNTIAGAEPTTGDTSSSGGYTTDFSTDPGWVTDQPTKCFSNGRAYSARAEDTAPSYQPNRYFYKPLSQAVGSLTLSWDLTISRCDWSAGIDFGIFDGSMKGSGSTGGQSIYVDFSVADPVGGDQGRRVSLYAYGTGGGTALNTSNGQPGWSLGQTYRCTVAYDAASQNVSLGVRNKPTGAVVGTASLAVPGGGFGNSLKRLGGSRFGTCDGGCWGVNPAGVAEGVIDNLELVPAAGSVQFGSVFD